MRVSGYEEASFLSILWLFILMPPLSFLVKSSLALIVLSIFQVSDIFLGWLGLASLHCSQLDTISLF
jgi:uncharacterized membrane protein